MNIDEKKFLNKSFYLKALVSISMAILIYALTTFINLWCKGTFEQNQSFDIYDNTLEKFPEKNISNDSNKEVLEEIAEILDRIKIHNSIVREQQVVFTKSEETDFRAETISKKEVIKRKYISNTKKDISIAISKPDTESFTHTNTFESTSAEPITIAEKKVAEEFYPESEAFRWLAEHQEADGHWDAGKYEGERSHEADCAVTGMAVLAYLNYGYSTKIGKWNKTIKLALNWLMIAQKPNGSWVSNNYANAICTLALADATSMGEGIEVKNATELGTNYILTQQNTNGLFDYTGPSKAGNMSVTGLCMIALKSALLADIKRNEIIKAFKKCESFLSKTINTKDNTINSKGLAWYTPNKIGTGEKGGACQAIAMVIRQNHGWLRTEPWLLVALDGQITHIPKQYKDMDIYRLYFANLAIYQYGSIKWKPWFLPVKKIILEAQRKEGDYKGSWDPIGDSCNKGGRVLYTAILCNFISSRKKWPSPIK